MAYDEYDAVKENHPFGDLNSVVPSKVKPTEFLLQWEGGTKETFICDHRNELLAVVYKLVDELKKVKTNKFKAVRLSRTLEVWILYIYKLPWLYLNYVLLLCRELKLLWPLELRTFRRWTKKERKSILLDGSATSNQHTNSAR